MRTRFLLLAAFCAMMTLVGVASLAAESPTADQLKTADTARVAFEKSGQDAAAAVVDDGFMTSAELAKKKAEAMAAGDPDMKAGWVKARLSLENTAWSVEPADITLTLGAWDRNKKQWPLTVASRDKRFPVVLNLVWNIASNSDPKGLYNSVNAQMKAQTLTARLYYSLTWQGDTVWRETQYMVDIQGKDAAGAETVLDSLTSSSPLSRWDLEATNPAKVVKAIKSDRIAFGDTGPAGGLVFYDKGKFSDGWRYLEAAPSDQSTDIKWYNESDVTAGATAKGIGSGKANTATIISQQGKGSYAAALCADLELGGYDDWFLPSEDELDLMYKNLQKAGLGSFTSTWYWSSTGYEGGSAWGQSFDDGSQDFSGKRFYDGVHVRAVRAF